MVIGDSVRGLVVDYSFATLHTFPNYNLYILHQGPLSQ